MAASASRFDCATDAIPGDARVDASDANLAKFEPFQQIMLKRFANLAHFRLYRHRYNRRAVSSLKMQSNMSCRCSSLIKSLFILHPTVVTPPSLADFGKFQRCADAENFEMPALLSNIGIFG